MRVRLTPEGACPNGHARSMLRDVREGELPAVATSVPQVAAVARPRDPSEDFWAVLIGRAFVIVPVAAFVAFALWTGYLQAVGSGTSVGDAVLMSIGSLALTIGGAWVWWRMRSRKH